MTVSPMCEQVTQESVQKLEQGGHRADIRAVALSADDTVLLSASNSAVKVGHVCILILNPALLMKRTAAG